MGVSGLSRLFSYGKVDAVKPLTSKEKKKRKVLHKISNESRRRNRPK